MDGIKTLADHEIADAIARNELVVDADPEGCKGACYELRMGNVYYDLTEDEKRYPVPTGGDVLIKPGHRVVLITHERLALNDKVFARIVSKGSLFSIGLSAVSTDKIGKGVIGSRGQEMPDVGEGIGGHRRALQRIESAVGAVGRIGKHWHGAGFSGDSHDQQGIRSKARMRLQRGQRGGAGARVAAGSKISGRTSFAANLGGLLRLEPARRPFAQRRADGRGNPVE